MIGIKSYFRRRKREKLMFTKNYQKNLDNRPVCPFGDAEEVWLWFCFCESSGDKGRSLGSAVSRPCETSDVAVILKRLVREKKILQEHLKVLSRFGLAQLPPHPQSGDSAEECRLWREALDFFDPIFRVKGIIGEGV